MSTPKLVGMIGKAQSGKDTFAQVLVGEGGFVRMAFADELKLDVAKFLGITVEELEARKDEFRSTLQVYGMHMREAYGIAYWIGRLEPLLTKALDAGDSIVITDVRYQNEANWIRSLGGVLIQRVRSDGVGLAGTQAQHSSETELDDIRPDHTCRCGTIRRIQDHARAWLTNGMWPFGCKTR